MRADIVVEFTFRCYLFCFFVCDYPEALCGGVPHSRSECSCSRDAHVPPAVLPGARGGAEDSSEPPTQGQGVRYRTDERANAGSTDVSDPSEFILHVVYFKNAMYGL